MDEMKPEDVCCIYCYSVSICSSGYCNKKLRRRYRCSNCSRTFMASYQRPRVLPTVTVRIRSALDAGRTYREISGALSVSSRTIAAVARKLK